MICPKCGAQCIDGSTFCVKCGENLKELSNINVVSMQQSVNQVNQSIQMGQEVEETNNQMPVNNIQFQQPVSQTQDNVQQQVNNNQQAVNNNQVVNNLNVNSVSMQQSTNQVSQFTQMEQVGAQVNNQMPVNNIQFQQSTSHIQDNIQQQINNNLQTMNNNQVVNNLNATNNNQVANNILYSKEELSKKSKNNILLIIIIVIMILLIGFGIYYFLVIRDNSSAVTDDDINETTFFLQDENKTLALFDEEGNRLTDFIFTDHDKFVNNYAIVRKNELYGILKNNGKMSVDFGKYSYICDVGGLFLVFDDEHNHYLINGKGTVVRNLENEDVLISASGDFYLIIENSQKKSYIVLDDSGKEITNFPFVDGASSPVTDGEDGYISIFYGNKDYIVNVNKKKVIASFNTSVSYDITYVVDSKNLIIMYSDGNTDYKYIKNNKLYDKSDKCDSISYNYDNMLICRKYYDGYKEYVMDDNFNIMFKVDGDLNYTDYNTYALKVRDSNFNVEFYDNGSLVKTIPCRLLRYSDYEPSGVYVLNTYQSSSCGTSSVLYDYYDYKGNQITNKGFKSAASFDDNKLAKVSEDGNKFYLIDTSGNKVTEEYDSIIEASKSFGYYIVENDSLKGILDKNGNKIVDCIYNNIQIVSETLGDFARLATADDKYVLYDLINKKEIVQLDSKFSFSSNYIYTRVDDVNKYYSYVNGKMFYEA